MDRLNYLFIDQNSKISKTAAFSINNIVSKGEKYIDIVLNHLIINRIIRLTNPHKDLVIDFLNIIILFYKLKL